MLTELERAIRFGALLGRIESLREEINRIHDSEPADFAAFVAQIPVSNDPDWDVEDSLSNDVCNAWAAWEDATLESHTVSSPESSNAAAAAATSSPLSNERLDKSNLKDTQSDASTLAILVQKFIYRPKRIKRDDGDGQPSAMQYLGQSSNGSPSGLKASATTALTAFSTTATLQSTSVHLQPPTSASASSSASASTSVSVSASASASASADVAHGIVTQIRPEGSKVRRMRHFFRLRDELVSLLSVFNVLENQEEDFEQARKQCIENYRRRRGQRTAHPLRQSMTMEEQEAISDKRLGKQKERTVWW
ncbi:hypothetical protein CH63R_13382 [Colletotrichum higginsianum IMI 349063]|uniref:Uncharacterized protein n=1 Tax=Colletotrichum higginsianum (strain IMI 349063) TaxID=759273 RepID=A0A1B7XWX9_COLHI|nr:hypothetical protein CH63R_13382 [Colletotrichum higginsianum IMI 349063]OBR04255.1 hypothetical protein CH63R_13382 [Colletotrichum higginsianum IMI 349063]